MIDKSSSTENCPATSMVKFMLEISMPSPACGADELGDDRADQREDHRDLEPGEDVGHRVRQLQHPEDLRRASPRAISSD